MDAVNMGHSRNARCVSEASASSGSRCELSLSRSVIVKLVHVASSDAPS